MEASFNDLALDDPVWMPSDLKVALDLDMIQVIFYEDMIKDIIIEDCYDSIHVGLTCVARRTESSFLVCITTSDKIYVIDTKSEKDTRFLERLLRENHKENLIFYIYKGQEAAYRLKTGYAIDVGCALDVSAMDVFLSMRRFAVSGETRSYSLKSLIDKGIKYRNRSDLALEYLNVRLPDPTNEDYLAIKDMSHRMRAENLIRKMSATTRLVGIRIQERIDRLTFRDSESIYSFGPQASNDDIAAFESLDDHSYRKLLGRLNSLQPERRDDAT